MSAANISLPRIGQEVLVHFVHGDIDRPIISKALYNGRGEGGVPPTPGGTPGEGLTVVTMTIALTYALMRMGATA